MSARTSEWPAPAGHATPEIRTAAAPRRRLRARHLWLIPGFAVAILGSRIDSSLAAIAVMVAAGTAPHLLAILAGLGQARPAGGLSPRALATFNALHEPLLPGAILAVGLTGLVPTLVFVGATAWLGHIVIGWGIGDGKRSRA